jgi:ABC-type uncharacterized transport system permease subunit
MTLVPGLLSIALYLGTAWLLASRLRAPSQRTAIGQWLTPAGSAVALILHGWVLHQLLVVEDGLHLGFFNAASLIGWVLGALVLITTLTRSTDSLGLFVLPLAATTVAFALAFPDETVNTASLSTGVQVHVVVSIVGYGLLALAALQAGLVSVQDRALRARRLRTALGALPSLTAQEGLLFQLMGAGFFFLSLSLVSGLMFVDNLLAQHLVHKTALAIIAWCVFGTLLWGRWRHGWRGRTVVRWSLIGFVFLMLAYFGAKLILEVILDRSWTT